MADIAMCGGDGCTLKDSCYRHVAKADEYRQSYFVSPPFTIADDKLTCDHYWETDISNNPSCREWKEENKS